MGHIIFNHQKFQVNNIIFDLFAFLHILSLNFISNSCNGMPDMIVGNGHPRPAEET